MPTPQGRKAREREKETRAQGMCDQDISPTQSLQRRLRLLFSVKVTRVAASNATAGDQQRKHVPSDAGSDTSPRVFP